MKCRVQTPNENPSISTSLVTPSVMDPSMRKRRLRKVVLVFVVIFVVGIFNVEYFIWNLQSHSETEKRKESHANQRYHSSLETENPKMNQFQKGIKKEPEIHGITTRIEREPVSFNQKSKQLLGIDNTPAKQDVQAVADNEKNGRGKDYALKTHNGITSEPPRTFVINHSKRNDRPIIENVSDNYDERSMTIHPETIEGSLPKEVIHAATNSESLTKEPIHRKTVRTSIQTEAINRETIKTSLSKEAIHEDNNKTNVTDDNLNGRADIFKSRWTHVVEVCTEEGRAPPRDLAHSQYFPKMYLELPHTILYCPVEKVASTFWWKTLTAMNSMGYYSSPYQVRGKRYKVKTYYRHTQSTRNLNMDLFNKYATSLLVVRDPYSKVFSAYVDKIYNPNVVFWNHIGKPIEKIIANKSDVNETKVCGHTASFAQYVKYLIYKFENQESINTHFTSISSHCDPCVTKYDFISKLETFKDDVQAILAHWNEKFNLNIQFRHFEKETAIEIARIHINLALFTKTETEKQCSIPSDLFLLRTWRFLQISGIIPKKSRFPDNWQDEWFIERPEYLMADVLNVIQGNISWPEVKSQRHEAMLQAYRTVPLEDMHKLREIVKADCKYFGYTDMPAELFNRSTTSLVSSDFNYFDAVK